MKTLTAKFKGSSVKTLSVAKEQYLSSLDNQSRFSIEDEIKSDLSFKDWETLIITGPAQSIMSIIGEMSNLGEDSLISVQ